MGSDRWSHLTQRERDSLMFGRITKAAMYPIYDALEAARAECEQLANKYRVVVGLARVVCDSADLTAWLYSVAQLHRWLRENEEVPNG